MKDIICTGVALGIAGMIFVVRGMEGFSNETSFYSPLQ
jgi:ABC-type lipoprotein release transport system permease subunit